MGHPKVRQVSGQRGQGPMDDGAVVFGDAAHSAAEATAEAIELAVETNDDPVVAEVLEEAALRADTTKARTGWLRSWLRRHLGVGPRLD